MVFIALEGADCTGKSAVQRRLVGTLIGNAERPVVPSKEPGSVDFDPETGEWSASKPPARIEDHLNTAERVLGIAASMAESDLAREVCLAAAFVARHKTYPPEVHKALLPGGPSLFATAFREEMGQILADWESVTKALELSPSLQEQFAGYTARDAIRHAILHSSDSENIPPTASGLMFFADHVLHGRMTEQLPDRAIVISDRTHLSQRAYARVRGDDTRVVNLYDEHRPVDVDHAVVLTAEAETIHGRLEDDEDTNASWDGAEHAMDVQQAYRDLADENAVDCGLSFAETDDRSPMEVAADLLTMDLSLGDT